MVDKVKRDRFVKSEKDQTSDPIVSSAIGRQLKSLYDEFSREPVPDRFTALLEQLADQERKKD